MQVLLFQQFQNCIYGDISIKKYLDVLKNINKDVFLPIYSGDAEVFNFRAGRFISERKKYMMSGKGFTNY